MAVRSAGFARWHRGGAAYRALERRFAGPAGDDPEPAAAAATELLADDVWVSDLIAPMIGALRSEPYFEPPFRVSRDGLRIGAVLFENAAVSITATVMSADALAAISPARTLVVPGRLAITRYVRAGGARLRLWSAEHAGADFTAADAAPCASLGTLSLSDGQVLRLDGRVRGHLIEGATTDMVMLSATLRGGASPFLREYDIATGARVRTAMLDDRAARSQMLLAYLRLAGRADASACFDAGTREDAFFLRWAAMREWLALDARAALPRLRAMAGNDPNGEVRAAAAAMLPAAERALAERCPG